MKNILIKPLFMVEKIRSKTTAIEVEGQGRG